MRAFDAKVPLAAQAASGLQEILAENTAVARELRDVRSSLEAAREERRRAGALAAGVSDTNPATCPAVCREAACSSNKVRAARLTMVLRSCGWCLYRWRLQQHCGCCAGRRPLLCAVRCSAVLSSSRTMMRRGVRQTIILQSRPVEGNAGHTTE